jgi:hypothetical protein
MKLIYPHTNQIEKKLPNPIPDSKTLKDKITKITQQITKLNSKST